MLPYSNCHQMLPITFVWTVLRDFSFNRVIIHRQRRTLAKKRMTTLDLLVIFSINRRKPHSRSIRTGNKPVRQAFFPIVLIFLYDLFPEFFFYCLFRLKGLTKYLLCFALSESLQRAWCVTCVLT